MDSSAHWHFASRSFDRRLSRRRATGAHELTAAEAAAVLRISAPTVLRLIRTKKLPATQACIGAPWVIRRDDILIETLECLFEQPLDDRAQLSVAVDVMTQCVIAGLFNEPGGILLRQADDARYGAMADATFAVEHVLASAFVCGPMSAALASRKAL